MTEYTKKYDTDFFLPESYCIIAEYLCPLCNGVADKPVIDICGHLFCEVCIAKHLNSLGKSKVCPITKDIYSNNVVEQIVHSMPYIKGILDRQKLKCVNKCEWVGKLGDFPDHEKNECKNIPITCVNLYEGCRVTLIRSEIDSHIETCEFKPSMCEFCNLKVAKKQIDDHLGMCPNFRVSCTNECDNTFQRKELEQHLKNDCVNTIIECTFSKIGCEVKTKRKDLYDHYNKESFYHSNLIVKNLTVLKEKIDTLDEENEDLKKKIEGLKREKAKLDTLSSPVMDLNTKTHKSTINNNNNSNGNDFTNKKRKRTPESEERSSSENNTSNKPKPIFTSFVDKTNKIQKTLTSKGSNSNQKTLNEYMTASSNRETFNLENNDEIEKFSLSPQSIESKEKKTEKGTIIHKFNF